MFITSLLFVDDILIFCSGTTREATVIAEILELFSKATGMEINARKSTLSIHMLRDDELQAITWDFPYNLEGLDVGLKYLGFSLKPNDYHIRDWKWLLDKMEKHLKLWSHKWLIRGGRLVLVKNVLEAIHVYWMDLSWSRD